MYLRLHSLARAHCRVAALALVALFALAPSFVRGAVAAIPPISTPPAAPPSGSLHTLFAGGLKNGWQDWGWAHRTIVPGQPAKLHMQKYAGWRLAKRDLSGSFSALRFQLAAPANFKDFLEVRLGAANASPDDFPSVAVTQSEAAGLVQLPMAALNPQALPFDQILFRAKVSVDEQEVSIDQVSLVYGAPPPKPNRAAFASKRERLIISCRQPRHAISPYIYGIAFSPRFVGKDTAPFSSGATIRRWGGNPASRYNHRLGNAWNTASDWFFRNLNYTKFPAYSWRDFLAENAEHNMVSAITVPTIGYVAKDIDSYSYSVKSLGAQKYSDGDAGNGLNQQGKPLAAPSPLTTSVAATPNFVAEWVEGLERVAPSTSGRAVAQYILDNEPALWNSTHRDIHPEPLTYDELLEKSVAYARAIRSRAPTADIAGPAEWGWPAYFFSAKDAAAGFRVKPDRLAHGDVPLLAWYLREMTKASKREGAPLLNTVDVHFYPQISGVYGHGEQTTPMGAEKRLRATRSLWDKTYKDESWIADNIELLPRLQRLIDENYPGRGISIGEYNFGGERHISGGLAQAEALGRFGEAGVRSAYLWTYPPEKSFSQAAFLAYRNFDGQGAHFLDESLSTRAAEQVSLFASRGTGPAADQLTAVALNMRREGNVEAEVVLDGCGDFAVVRAFGFDEDHAQLAPLVGESAPSLASKRQLKAKLPAYSLTVFELRRR